MTKRLKKSVKRCLYGMSISLLLGGVGVMGYSLLQNEANEYKYSSKGMMDYQPNIEVVSPSISIIRPYVDESVSIVKGFYDYKTDSESQEKSLIYYEGTYIPSSGISYSNSNSFDVISILPGTVKEVREDDILGNVVVIEHENGIISEYQSITDIKVKKDDIVNQGQIIAKSSESNISKDLGNHLYFEIIINGENVNPEEYYNKTINEI